MYTSLITVIEATANECFNALNPIGGSFVHLQWSDIDDAFNVPKPIIGLYQANAIPDRADGSITYNIGLLFLYNDNQDNSVSDTTTALNSAELLYWDFLSRLEDKGYSVNNPTAEREVKIFNAVLSGWSLTFTTKAHLPC